MKILKLFLFSLILLLHYPAFAAEKESAYDRVLRTNTLRCAYTSISGYIRKDANNGNIVGPVADIAAEMAKELSLKLEWTEEVGYADFAEGLRAGRYDAYCGLLSMTPQRARVATYTDPLFYLPLYVFVRQDETRFKSLSDMNKPDVKSGVTDGEIFMTLTKKYLPQATVASLPSMSAAGQLFIDLANKKSDVLINDNFAYMEYAQSHPNQIRLAFSEPLGVNALSFAVAPKEQALRDMLSTTLLYLQHTGKVDSILTSYKLGDNMTFRMAPLYNKPVH